jgi:hypothetical protein
MSNSWCMLSNNALDVSNYALRECESRCGQVRRTFRERDARSDGDEHVRDPAGGDNDIRKPGPITCGLVSPGQERFSRRQTRSSQRFHGSCGRTAVRAYGSA